MRRLPSLPHAPLRSRDLCCRSVPSIVRQEGDTLVKDREMTHGTISMLIGSMYDSTHSTHPTEQSTNSYPTISYRGEPHVLGTTRTTTLLLPRPTQSPGTTDQNLLWFWSSRSTSCGRGRPQTHTAKAG